MSAIETQKATAASWFQRLRDEICASFETLEDEHAGQHRDRPQALDVGAEHALGAVALRVSGRPHTVGIAQGHLPTDNAIRGPHPCDHVIPHAPARADSAVFGDPCGGEALQFGNIRSQARADRLLEIAADQRNSDVHPHREVHLRPGVRRGQ